MLDIKSTTPDKPKTLYHASPADNVEAILAQGLKHSLKPNFYISKRRHVCLATNQFDALMPGICATLIHYLTRTVALFRIDTQGFQEELRFNDEYTKQRTEWSTYQFHIPAKFITAHAEYTIYQEGDNKYAVLSRLGSANKRWFPEGPLLFHDITTNAMVELKAKMLEKELQKL